MDFQDRLSHAEKRLSSCQKSISLLRQFLSSHDYSKIVEESFHLAKLSEAFTEETRLLPIFTGSPGAKETVEDIMIDSFPVTISKEPFGYHFHIPALLPKKEKGRAGYIRAMMISACKKYSEEKQPSVIREPVVLTFLHNYSSSNRQWRDHDNIEVNVAVDAIALYFLEDDTGKSCDHFYFSKEAEKDSTDIFLILQKDFQKWLLENYREEERKCIS